MGAKTRQRRELGETALLRLAEISKTNGGGPVSFPELQAAFSQDERPSMKKLRRAVQSLMDEGLVQMKDPPEQVVLDTKSTAVSPSANGTGHSDASCLYQIVKAPTADQLQAIVNAAARHGSEVVAAGTHGVEWWAMLHHEHE